MTENMISRILRAEAEYHAALEKSSQESDLHKESLQKKQNEVLDNEKRQWHLFEETCDIRYKEELSKQQEELEQDFLRRKQELRNRQQQKADIISERLKKEVLTLYGDR